MRKIRVFIERGKDGSFSAYMPDDNKLSYGVIGEGNSAEEAKQDFLDVYEAMKNNANEKNRVFEEVEFEFSFDIPSFLLYYSDIISYKGLAKLTGISSPQISQYISGYRSPSQKTREKIQNALHALGNELSRLQLV